MQLHKPMLPACFLHWTDPARTNDDDVFRIVSWRRNLTLKGKSFQAFEESVLPLLTGAFTVDQICEKVAHVFQKDDVVASLNMLAAQGIVVEGDDHQPHQAPQLGWLGEAAPAGRAAQHKLTDAHVVIVGAGSHGAVTARALVAAGIGRLTIVDPAPVATADLYFSGSYKPDDIGENRAETLASALAQNDGTTTLTAVGSRPADVTAMKQHVEGASLVLCCVESGELNLALLLNLACRESRVPWIAAALEGTELVVGPGFFHTANAPCYMCWRLREIAGATNPQSRFAVEQYLDRLRTDLSGRRENLAPSADIVGGMLSAEALTWLTGVSAPNLDGRFIVVGLPGLRMEKHMVLRKPGCPVCSGDQGGTQ
ncbi:TOMM precursor leader peptide-binding protein [Yoonia sp. I 8.24]|uniref:TOMM precursor leader peptide-binding protein n=1 Tax=Yoonia sp. I 8.24 TaxID=1537229 RepID=UPI001EDFD874|nr:TOMM precursor leader peptide-binding protein [Yoonia sp. I 8.24]MCG3268319.1 TOMM precursor leader peptide-binding protein [Yoonia sp. I 8.24]